MKFIKYADVIVAFLFSANCLANTPEMTDKVSTIFKKGYMLQAIVKNDIGIVIPATHERVAISNSCSLKVKPELSFDRILKKGRVINFEVNDISSEWFGLASTQDKTVNGIEIKLEKWWTFHFTGVAFIQNCGFYLDFIIVPRPDPIEAKVDTSSDVGGVQNIVKLSEPKLENIASKFNQVCSTLNTDEQYCEVSRLTFFGGAEIDLRSYILKTANNFTNAYENVSLISAYHPIPGNESDPRYNFSPEERFNGYYQELFSSLSPKDITRINKLKELLTPFLKDTTHRLVIFFNSVYWSSYDGIIVTDEKYQEALLIVSAQME